jgi:hypothetical protein
MRSRTRLAVAIALGLLVLVGGSTGAAAYAWHRAGSVRIAIHEAGPSGSDLSLTLPALLVNTAIAVCPVPKDVALNARLHELSPALRAVAARLETLPDVVLVDVKSHDGIVRVEKSGGELLIRVVSREDRIDIAVPVESVRQLMQKFEV